MIIYKDGVRVEHYSPSYNGASIVVAIDSSKSNSAIIVGDLEGNILDDYEISGAGADVDVYQLCWDARKELCSLFDKANVVLVGIEDIITKKEKGYKGLDIHQSRAKITAVFNNFIFFFQDYHNITPITINNWEWKSHTLPEEYRKKDHKKGSKDYFEAIGSPYAGRKDDVTDAVCIYRYLSSKHHIKVQKVIKETKPSNVVYDWFICPSDTNMSTATEDVIQNNDTLAHNAQTVATGLSDNVVGYFVWDINKVPIEVIYSDRLKGVYSRNISEVYIVVRRV